MITWYRKHFNFKVIYSYFDLIWKRWCSDALFSVSDILNILPASCLHASLRFQLLYLSSLTVEKITKTGFLLGKSSHLDGCTQWPTQSHQDNASHLHRQESRNLCSDSCQRQQKPADPASVGSAWKVSISQCYPSHTHATRSVGAVLQTEYPPRKWNTQTHCGRGSRSSQTQSLHMCNSARERHAFSEQAHNRRGEKWGVNWRQTVWQEQEVVSRVSYLVKHEAWLFLTLPDTPCKSSQPFKK